MPAGLQITGTAGNVLIGEDAIGYCVVGSGTATMQPGNTAAVCPYADVVVSGTNPTLALQGNNITCSSGVSIGGGQWRFHIVGGSVGQVVTYYVLDRPNGGSSYGLQVFNAAGACVFDALRFSPKVVHAGPNPRNDLPTGNYAVLVCFPGTYMNPANPPGSNYQVYYAYTTTTTGAVLGSFNGYLWPDNIHLTNAINGYVLTLDVSHIFS